MMNVIQTTAASERSDGVLEEQAAILLPTKESSRAKLIGAPKARIEPMHRFVRWAAAQVGITVSIDGQQLQVVVPDTERDHLGGDEVLKVPFDELQLRDGGHENGGRSPAEPAARFLPWLLERLKSRGPAVHSRPSHQPVAVHAIASKLFAAYQIDNGRIYLGGCQLEDRPFLRLSYRDSRGSKDAVRHIFISSDGSATAEKLIDALGLDRLEPAPRTPKRISNAEISTLIASGRRMSAHSPRPGAPGTKSDQSPNEPLAVSVVWAKYASGQLHCTIGDETAVLRFAGWAKSLQAPAYRCPHTGTSAYHLAATDDGRIVPATEVETCDYSGRRVLEQELVDCHHTGRRMLPEFTEICPALGKSVCRDEFETCGACRQHVSSAALVSDRGCRLCAQAPQVSPSDPRLIWLITQHPQLADWRRWQLSETDRAYIAVATGRMRKLLLVALRESLEVQHLATGLRYTSRWSPVEPDRWDAYLG